VSQLGGGGGDGVVANRGHRYGVQKNLGGGSTARRGATTPFLKSGGEKWKVKMHGP